MHVTLVVTAKYIAFLDSKNKGLTKEIAKGLRIELD
jgi:hypothetical protein